MARSFNGSSDKIVIGTPAVLDITGIFTFSIWANAVSFPTTGSVTDLRVLMGKGYDGSKEQIILRYAGVSGVGGGNAQLLTCFYFDGTNGHGVEWVQTNSTGTWYHIVGQWTGSVWALYNNGVAVGSTGGTQIAPAHSAAGFDIGCEDLNGTPSRFFNGSLADAAVWNTNLSAGNITSLFNGVRPINVNSANLVGWWPLDGYASPETDLSGQGNNGTLTGTAQVLGPPALWRISA